jgi:CTP-dependent riboflavin kinase
MSVAVLPAAVTRDDLEWLHGMTQIDSPVPERAIDAKRLARLLEGRYVEKAWSGRGWFVSLTERGRRLVQEDRS